MNIMKQQRTTLVQPFVGEKSRFGGQACAKVNGFKALHKRLEKKIVVGGKSMSTLYNYMRCIAPVALDIEQIEDYLPHSTGETFLLRTGILNGPGSPLHSIRNAVHSATSLP